MNSTMSDQRRKNRHKISVVIGMVLLTDLTGWTAEEARPKDFGKQWVRTHPFAITGLVQRNEAAIGRMYVDAGLNLLLIWKDRPDLFAWAVKQGIPWHYHLDHRKSTDELQKEIERFVRTYPGGTGILVRDEPKLPEMQAAGELAAWVKAQYPELLVYANAYGMVWSSESQAKLAGEKWIASGLYDEPPFPYSYADYLEDFVRIIRPDVLMMDQYPFIKPPEGDPAVYYQERYFENLSAMREAAMRANIPFWLFIQAYEAEGARRLPSESDVRMQVYSSLACGATGIAYFTYDHVFTRALLDESHSPTRLYRDVAILNKEVANLGRTLRFLTSTDVRYVRGRPPTLQAGRITGVPRGIGIYLGKRTDGVPTQSRVATLVTDISIQDGGTDRNALIGFFKDDQGDPYFMIVNLTHGEGKTANETALSVTLTLTPSVKTLTRLSRQTGNPEPVEIKANQITLELPGGTGELFKLNDANFPGLETRNNSEHQQATAFR